MEMLCFYGVFLFQRVCLANLRFYRGRKRKDEQQAQEAGTNFRIFALTHYYTFGYKYTGDDIPFLRQYDTKIIVNICGHTLNQYCSVVEQLSDCDIDMLELNISCPNVEEGGLSFGTDTKVVERVVTSVKHFAEQPLIVKLSPEVTDISEIAKAAVSGGADAISLINTLRGMKIDIHKRKAVLANKIGGYSGPGIMPIAVRMVYEVCKAVAVPVIGMGGISTFEDALEFIMAGATAIAVGTANFNNPYATVEIIDGIQKFLLENHIASINEIKGII